MAQPRPAAGSVSLKQVSAVILALSMSYAGAAAQTASVPAQSGPDEDVLAVQVALARAGFSPGVLDAHMGRATKLALAAFQTAHRLKATGTLDPQTSSALNIDPAQATATVTEDEASVGPIGGPLPQKPEDAAGLSAMPYASFEEALAEKYHTTAKALAALNPGVDIAPGATLRVPNIAVANDTASALWQPASAVTTPTPNADAAWEATLAALNVASTQPAAAKIIVNKARGDIRAFDASGRLIAEFPATIGSKENPSPAGSLKIKGVSHLPHFKYDSEVLGEKEKRKQFELASGPNNLVGVVWLELSKPHNGIHGTPNPELIGRAESHGCVRMTNWDAARLAQMVKPGTPVIFESKRRKRV